MKQGIQGRCTRTTQRDGIGREAEGDFGIGDACAPVAGSYQCMVEFPLFKPTRSTRELGKSQLSLKAYGFVEPG